jgi:hypothetical protein
MSMTGGVMEIAFKVVHRLAGDCMTALIAAVLLGSAHPTFATARNAREISRLRRLQLQQVKPILA